MFRVSYIDAHDRISHKGGFKSTLDAMNWVRAQGNAITPLKLLVWDEELQCYSELRAL